MIYSFLNREITHPGITKYFNAGALSIRRTAKQFSRTDHDIMLVQTVNKDSAPRNGGVSNYITDPAGRKRWSISRSASTRVISLLCNNAKIQEKDDIVKVSNHLVI